MANRLALATLLATLPFASLALAADPFAPQDTETTSVSRVFDNGLDLTVKTTRKTRTLDDGSVETTENVEVHATLDGQPVPAERIRRDGNRVEILDERGTTVQRVVVASGGSNRPLRTAPPPSPPAAAPPARPMLGVTLEEPDEPLVKQLRLAPGRTTLLTSILPDSPAAKAGLETYDLVVGIAGREDASPEAIREFLAGAKIGDAVSLAIVRGGERREATVTLEAMSDAMAARLDSTSALDPSIRQLVERLRARGIELDPADLAGAGTVFVPTPSGPGGGSMRFAVPRTGVPIAPTAPDLRELELRMQEMRREMERTRQELERFRATPPAPPAAPSGRDA